MTTNSQLIQADLVRSVWCPLIFTDSNLFLQISRWRFCWWTKLSFYKSKIYFAYITRFHCSFNEGYMYWVCTGWYHAEVRTRYVTQWIGASVDMYGCWTAQVLFPLYSSLIWLVYMYFSCSQRLKQLNFNFTKCKIPIPRYISHIP